MYRKADTQVPPFVISVLMKKNEEHSTETVKFSYINKHINGHFTN